MGTEPDTILLHLFPKENIAMQLCILSQIIIAAVKKIKDLFKFIFSKIPNSFNSSVFDRIVGIDIYNPISQVFIGLFKHFCELKLL